MQPDTSKDDWIRMVLDKGIYAVTSDGQIMNLRSGHTLKQSLMSDGYCRVGLSVDGETVYVKAHRVVAIAHVPNPGRKPIVNHKDGVKNNNHPKNLEWVTSLENSKHAASTGLYQGVRGVENHNAKLSQAQVDEIRSRYAKGGISQSELGRIYGVKQNTVSVIVNRVNWA